MMASSRLVWSIVFTAATVPAAAATVPAGGPVSVAAASGPALAAWADRVERLERSGDLVSVRTRQDTMIAGRVHERLVQFHQGVPVFGSAVNRQNDASGPLTVFGTYYEGIDVDVRPRLGAREIEARVAAAGGRPAGSRGGPELVIFPLDAGGYRLAWRVRAFFENPFDIRQTVYDASTGDVLLDYCDLQTQAAGIGTGVLGDRKKVSVATGGLGFTTSDRLRPPSIQTYDFRFNVGRLIRFLNIGPTDLTTSDLATDADNDWTDGAVVDAHAYAGYTYDYYYRRFGRRGLDDANVTMHSITHAISRDEWRYYTSDTVGTFFANAAYLGEGVMYYGDGLPPSVTFGGLHWNYTSGGLDVVAHELSHGVSDYSAGLIYEGHSGALSEAFSDIMGVSAEFFAQPEKADYLIGEDVASPGALRSIQNPKQYGDPDHLIDFYNGPLDNGGVHYNSTIASHAFYLSVEGGRHRMGAVVNGVGAANREQIERIWYRAVAYLFTPRIHFCEARTATLRSATELHGENSAQWRAVEQAWTAVGNTMNCGLFSR
jgi:bacillolysin